MTGLFCVWVEKQSPCPKLEIGQNRTADELAQD